MPPDRLAGAASRGGTYGGPMWTSDVGGVVSGPARCGGIPLKERGVPRAMPAVQAGRKDAASKLNPQALAPVGSSGVCAVRCSPTLPPFLSIVARIPAAQSGFALGLRGGFVSSLTPPPAGG